MKLLLPAAAAAAAAASSASATVAPPVATEAAAAMHMMQQHPNLAAQAQAGTDAAQTPSVAPMHNAMQQQQQQQQQAQIPHGGYEPAAAALQPSHQPSQQPPPPPPPPHQQQHRYPPASSPTFSSVSASTVSGAGAGAGAGAGTTSSASAAPAGRLGHVLHTMQQTGFHAWGFVIYRGCSYADDAAWQRFVACMKQEVHNTLLATPRLPPSTTTSTSSLDTSGRQLAPYLEWTVIEDPRLENASKDAVRAHFASWAAARSPRRDGPGADGPFIESHVPRFMYCVYVDQRCLRTLAAFDDWLRLDRNGPMQYLACALVDKNCPPGGEGAAGMPLVDGCDRYYTGWMYAHVGSLPELYNTLGHQRLISGPNNYARPPRIYPGHLYGASVPP
ncbi:hypothetical protein MY11210_007687 [Beauveria gryllotalpidicola]